jgi:GT2 family glycosyltransferase
MNTMNQPKVTVIVVAYNAEGMKSIFKQCLDSSLNLKYDNYEVIVVNNGSIDKTREILEAYEKDLKVINLKKNYGLAGARNIAYKNSKSEFVLLLDSDVIAEQDSLKELVKASISDNKIEALGGIQVDYKKRNITMLGWLFDIYGNWITTNYEVMHINEVEESYYTFIPTAFLLAKRKAIGNILHPKEFFTYIEDIELCFRLWSRGYRIKLIPFIACRHEFGTSVRTASKKNPFLSKMLSYHFVKNSALMLSVYRKFLPKSYILQLLASLLYRPIHDVIRLSQYLMYLLNKEIYYFANYYNPLETFAYFNYSIKKLSTLDDYGIYIPLLLKLNNSKRFLLSPSKNIFGRLMILDYEQTIINEEDINRSIRKFIVPK